MNNNATIAKNTLLLGVRMVIVTIITIFTTRLLLDGLGVEDYGVYNVTVGIVSLCSFLTPAMANGVQRFFNFEIGKHDVERAKNVFNTGLRIQIGVALVVIVICETIGLWYVFNKLVVPEGRFTATLIVYQISIAALVISLLQVPYMAAVMGHEKMDFYALISTFDAVLKLCIAFSLKFSLFDNLVLYSILLLCVSIFDLVVYIWYTTKKFPEIRVLRRISPEHLKPMLSFSGWNLLEKFARIGKDQGLNLMLNFYFGPTVNAARGVVNQISYAFTGLIDSTITASRPQSIQAYARGEVQRTMNIMFSISKFTLLFLFALILPVYLEAPYILHIWLGEKIPELTLPLLNVTLITIIVDKLSAPLSVVVHATGKMKVYNLVSGIFNLAVLPVSLFALMRGASAVTVYWIVFIISIITHCAFLFTLKKLVEYSIRCYIYDVVLRSLIVVTLTSFLPYYIHIIMNEGFIRLLFVLITSITVCVLVSYILGLNKSEKILCMNLITSFFSKIR